jgi:hypothetical protein
VIRLIFLLLASSVAVAASAQTETPTPLPAPLTPPVTATAPKAPQRREPPQTMMLTVSMSGSDAEDSVSGGTAEIPITGFHTDADAMLTYQRKLGRVTIDALGRSVLRYAPSSEVLTTTSHDQGELALTFLSRHDRFQARQSVSYSPYYQFGALPDDAASPLTETAQSHGDFANSSLRAVNSTTVLDYSRTISRRDALVFAYNLRRTTFADQDLDLTSQNGGIHLVHQFTRTMALRAGYAYRSADSTFTQNGTLHSQDIDLGLDYSRALGPSKRTTFTAGSGSSTTPSATGMAFNVTGNAMLTRQIGRTWRARLGATRSVQLLEGFTEPLLTNTGIVDVGGNLGRRLSVSASASYAAGVIGLDANDANNNYENGSGAAGVRLRLSRWTALETQYSYYGHRFDSGVQLAPGVVSGLRRHGVRVSLTWLRPVLQ